jgi:hypothetical protein
VAANGTLRVPLKRWNSKGHHDVHRHDIGAERRGLADRLVAAASDTDNFDSTIGREADPRRL